MSGIRPLTGQVLVEMLPPEKQDGLLFLPDLKKERPIYGIVRNLGAWPKSRNGYGILPDFGIGARVIVSPWVGQKVNRDIGEKLKLVRMDDVLAVVI